MPTPNPEWFERAQSRAANADDGQLSAITEAVAVMFAGLHFDDLVTRLGRDQAARVVIATSYRAGIQVGVQLAGVEAGLNTDLVPDMVPFGGAANG